MTTAAEALLDSLFTDGQTTLTTEFSIDFAPTLEFETVFGAARNFVLFGSQEGLFLNDGIVRDVVKGNGDTDVIVSNTGTIGSSGRENKPIALVGDGQRVVLNDGEINGTVQLGSGSDLIYNSGNIANHVNMGGGDDFFFQTATGTVVARIHTGDGDDVVFNSGSIDYVNLGNGNDLYADVNAVGGTGRILGGAGNDTIRGGEGDEDLRGGTGRDLLEGNDGDDRLFGQHDKDTLRGGEGNDKLFGASGSDLLDGGADNDLLKGGTGRDTLIGGRGNDTVIGGSGDDVFIFEMGSGRDTITDFAGDDVIQLVNDGGGAAVTFADVEQAITYGNGHALIDLNEVFSPGGFGGPVNTILVRNVLENSLTADDFIL